MFLVDRLWSLLADYTPSPPVCPFDQGEAQVKELFQKYKYQEIFKGSVPGVTRLNVAGPVAVLALEEAPQVVLKIEGLKNKLIKSYYVNYFERRSQETNALELRAQVADKLRKIIQEQNLYLLEVPKKRVIEVLPGIKGILAQRMTLTNPERTRTYISRLSEEDQALYASQLVQCIVVSGYQDIDERNIAFTPNGKLALFDTEPQGMTKEKVSALVWRALQNFKDFTPFSKEVKSKVLQSAIVPEKYRQFFEVKRAIPAHVQKHLCSRV